MSELNCGGDAPRESVREQLETIKQKKAEGSSEVTATTSGKSGEASNDVNPSQQRGGVRQETPSTEEIEEEKKVEDDTTKPPEQQVTPESTEPQEKETAEKADLEDIDVEGLEEDENIPENISEIVVDDDNLEESAPPSEAEDKKPKSVREQMEEAKKAKTSHEPNNHNGPFGPHR